MLRARVMTVVAAGLVSASIAAQENKAEKPAQEKPAQKAPTYTDAYARWVQNVTHPRTGGGQKCTNCHAGESVSWNQPASIADYYTLKNVSGVWRTAGQKTAQAAISLTVTDETTRTLLGLKEPGLVVSGVCPSEEADLAGLSLHDVILKVNGKPAKSASAVHQAILSPDALGLVILRKGKQEKLTRDAKKPAGSQRYLIGVTLGELEPVVRAQLDLDEKVTVFIREVSEDSAAAAAGVKPHDILLKLNGKPVANNEAVQSAVRDSKGKALRLTLRRGDETLTLNVTPRLVEVPAPGWVASVSFDPPGQIVDTPVAYNQLANVQWAHNWPTTTANSPNLAEVAKKLNEIDKKLDEINSVLKALRKREN